MRIALIGGHGKVALLAARLLEEQGHEVISIVRNPDHVAEVEETGAQAIVADVERADPDTMTKLVGGHDAVIWSAGAGGGNPSRTYAVDRDAAIMAIEGAEKAGVPRFVMVSYFGAGRPDRPHGVAPDNDFFAYAEAKAAADQRLRGSALNWTILGPSALTLDPGTGAIDVNDGSLSSGSVARADVAAVIAAVVGRDDLRGRTIEFNTGATPSADL